MGWEWRQSLKSKSFDHSRKSVNKNYAYNSFLSTTEFSTLSLANMEVSPFVMWGILKSSLITKTSNVQKLFLLWVCTSVRAKIVNSTKNKTNKQKGFIYLCSFNNMSIIFMIGIKIYIVLNIIKKIVLKTPQFIILSPEHLKY